MPRVAHQERQRVVDPWRILVRNTRLHRTIGTHANKQGVVIALELRHRHVLAHLAVQLEADPHRGKDLSAPREQRFIELKCRDAKGQQTADLRMPVIDRHAHAAARQHVGARQPGGPRADNRDTFT